MYLYLKPFNFDLGETELFEKEMFGHSTVCKVFNFVDLCVQIIYI